MMLDAVIITKNEQYRIQGSIERLLPYLDRILVVDDSTDKTADIAMSMGAEVHILRNSRPVDARNHADEILGEGWHLHVDADEIFDPYFLKNISMYTSDGAYRFPRINQPGAFDYPDYQIRWFKWKPGIEWIGHPHEVLSGIKDTFTLTFNILHGERNNELNRPWW